jgi:hypothetical protein
MKTETQYRAIRVDNNQYVIGTLKYNLKNLPVIQDMDGVFHNCKEHSESIYTPETRFETMSWNEFLHRVKQLDVAHQRTKQQNPNQNYPSVKDLSDVYVYNGYIRFIDGEDKASDRPKRIIYHVKNDLGAFAMKKQIEDMGFKCVHNRIVV